MTVDPGRDADRTHRLPVVGGPRRPSRPIRVVVAVVALVAAGGIGYAVTAVPPTPPPVVAAPSTEVNPAPDTTPAAPPPAGTTSFAAWRSGGGLDHVNALSSDLGAVAATAPDDVAGVEVACATLQSDVGAARAYLPMPDAAAQRSWADAQDRAGQGATDCTAGARKGDGALRATATDELSAASTALAAVDERMSFFSAH